MGFFPHVCMFVLMRDEHAFSYITLHLFFSLWILCVLWGVSEHPMTITTTPEDRAMEEKDIQEALKTCQHPQWATDKGAKAARRKETGQKRKKKPTS